MSRSGIPIPLSRAQAIEMYFMEHRAKLIDIAAFLDRIERAPAEPGPPTEDFRLAAFRDALRILSDGRPQRAKRVLESFSDPSIEPIPAAGMKGALGAHQSPLPKSAGAQR